MTASHEGLRHFLVASDFDQTLSFHDSGRVLAEMLGVEDFDAKVEGLARINLVQQGGELAYLIRHDPAFRQVRREQLYEAGRRVRLRHNIPMLVDFLARGIPGFKFSFYVISAAPREIVHAALEGIVPADHIVGTEFEYDPVSGEVRSIARVPAGYGKVAALEDLRVAARDSPRSHDLCRRRQFRRPRHAARQQPRRLHDRSVREQAPRAHRQAHGAE
jgi:hypothetical protein